MRTVTTTGAIAALVLFGVVTMAPALAGGQATNPRYGTWRLRSADAAKPSTNVMTYEPHNGTGMKITINRLEPDGTLTPQWGYTTMFDGKDEPMTGSRAKETAAVRMLSDRTAEITYTRDGRVRQILTNVISPDGQTLGIIYMTQDAEGRTTRVSFATYDRMK